MLIKSRREFFKTSFGALAGASALGRFGEMTAMAANPSNAMPYQALVCVFLAGGNDGHNVVFPISTTLNGAPQNYAQYAGARQTLALPSPQLNAPNVIYDGANEYALHPNLVEIAGLYKQGAAALVANVGNLVQPIVTKADLNNGTKIPSQLFSHADQVSQWQTAIPNGSATNGWGGRAEDLMGPTVNANAQFSPITSTSGCGLFCSGQNTFASTVPGGLNNITGNDGKQYPVQSLWSNNSAAGAGYCAGADDDLPVTG